VAGRRILRVHDERFEVAVETPYRREQHLQDAIAAHPEVLPSEDIGRGPFVTVATEIDFGHGPIDLLVVDPQGRLAIVEFKKGTENPDVRVVVAQVLDYGTSLWQTVYEELERKAQTVTNPRFAGSLVDHAEERFAGLGVEIFDRQAFVEGVSSVLESGELVFIYAGRDLDERTRRIMTFLSEGAKMTFFAVEVEHYLPENADYAVMVPRTAYVPSWIAAGGSPARRQAARTRMADADVATLELVRRMDEVAATEGWAREQALTGFRYLAPGRRGYGYAGIYASERGLELNLEPLQGGDHTELIDTVLAALSEARGAAVTARSSPSISAAEALQGWDVVCERALKPFLALRRPETGP
jgi:hypothetical protein